VPASAAEILGQGGVSRAKPIDGACVWEFGNMRNGNTFGGDAQWGKVGPTTLGAFASAIRPNPDC
jgi:hypothetical protein